MSLVFALGLAAATSPQTAAFIVAVRRGDWRAVSALTDGAALLHPATQQEMRLPAIPVDAIPNWVRGCSLSPSLSEQKPDHFDLWWNCGTHRRPRGQVWRTAVRVQVYPAGRGVKLVGLNKAHWPDATSGAALRAERIG